MLTIPTDIATHHGYEFADGEQLAETAYDNLLKIVSMLPDKRIGHLQGMLATNPKKEDTLKMAPFHIMDNGLYILGAKRPQWIGYFDVNVDELPSKASVLLKCENPSKNFAWTNFKQIPKLPKGVWAGGKSRSAVAVYQVDHNILVDFNSSDKKRLNCEVHHMLVAKDGSIVMTEDAMKNIYWNTDNSLKSHYYGSAALSMISDSKYLWTVECWDGQTHWAKVIFGVEMEEVKSLMFARDLPMTATGRKRPILHWVRAHARRIAEGIQVDVRKHMRGITEFEMGDLHFKITSPIKTVGEVYT